MNITISTTTASDGAVLHYRQAAPAGPPRGYVVGLHGIQSHSGWYVRTIERLAEAGYDVRFCDRRGAGLNTQARGDAPHLDRLVNDVVAMLSAVAWDRDAAASRQRPPKAPAGELAPPRVRAPGDQDAFQRAVSSASAQRPPLCLLGISWGGRLAAAAAMARPELVDGLALLCPGIFSKFSPGPLQRLGLLVAERLGVRRRLLPIPLSDPALFTEAPEWRRFIANDEHTLRHVTLGFLYADRRLSSLLARPGEHGPPAVLLQLAGRDRIIDNARVRRWLEFLPAASKRVMEYPDAAHTLEFDACRDTATGDLLEWLEGLPRVHRG